MSLAVGFQGKVIDVNLGVALIKLANHKVWINEEDLPKLRVVNFEHMLTKTFTISLTDAQVSRLREVYEDIARLSPYTSKQKGSGRRRPGKKSTLHVGDSCKGGPGVRYTAEEIHSFPRKVGLFDSQVEFTEECCLTVAGRNNNSKQVLILFGLPGKIKIRQTEVIFSCTSLRSLARPC